VPPQADTDTIKKSFRRLAHQFHPDKNADNAFAHAHFSLIKEAYEVLTDAVKRKEYDKELWLLQQNTIRYTQAITPELILDRVHHVADAIVYRKTHHVIENHLTDYLCSLLNDHNIAVFQQKAGEEQYAQCCADVLALCTVLPEHQCRMVTDRLTALCAQQETQLERIQAYLNSRKHTDRYQKNIAWIILAIAILLCIAMYWYSLKV
jgi:hypothetical protein